MVRVIVKPNRKGLSTVKRVSLKEPLSREHLIEKTIPYDSYVARRMRELGVYDMGLTPSQIAAVQTELITVNQVKKTIDKNDIMDAVEKAKQNQLQLIKETKAVLGDVRDYQKQLVELKQQKNDTNASKLIGKIETGVLTDDRSLLERPQEQAETTRNIEQIYPALGKLKRILKPYDAGTSQSIEQSPIVRKSNVPAAMERLKGILAPYGKPRSVASTYLSQAQTEQARAEELRDVEELVGDEPVAWRLRKREKKIKYGKGISGMHQGLKVAMPNPMLMRPPIQHPMSLRI